LSDEDVTPDEVPLPEDSNDGVSQNEDVDDETAEPHLSLLPSAAAAAPRKDRSDSQKENWCLDDPDDVEV
jgi:hypothetical protein